MVITKGLMEKAYKKLKSSIYFDKTTLPLRDKIVEFEASFDLNKTFEDILHQFEDADKWNAFKNEILDSIEILAYPKKTIDIKNDTFIINSVPDKTKINEIQYFINMDVWGHIFGTIWILLIGQFVDKNGYEHSYGNRIRKSLINEVSKKPTYTPYLFEPYFQQYESWRDTALTEAQKCIEKNQDVVILTLDFSRYYYSIDLTKNSFDSILQELPKDYFKSKKNEAEYKKIHDFIFEIIEKYSQNFKIFKERTFLPIGFLPSNVLANWSLNSFDKTISNGWNPLYYGRYVDDILIVDKIEKNSDIYQKSIKNDLSQEDIVNFFLEKCTRWEGLSNSHQKTNLPLFKKTNLSLFKKINDEFVLNQKYTVDPKGKSEIKLQNKKVKIFYFKSSESDALITCFRNEISKNNSEFRYLPEDLSIFQTDDYSSIYNLKKTDTHNKLRGV